MGASMIPARRFRLVHYSPRRLTHVDPKHFGANRWTSQSEVAGAAMPRAFWYEVTERSLVAPEASLRYGGGDKYRHYASVDLRIYDVFEDPLGFVALAQERGSDWQQDLFDAGYDGFRSSHPSFANTYSGDTLAVWRKIPVDLVEAVNG